MSRYLLGLFIFSTTVFGTDQPANKYEVVTMTPEQVEKEIAGKKHYDFDIAPDGGLVDASGKAIRIAELPEYLKAHALAPDAAYFLWVTPTSAPLSAIEQTVRPLVDYGITKVVVRNRPEVVNNNSPALPGTTEAAPKKVVVLLGKPNPGAIDATEKFPSMEGRPAELRPDPLPGPVRYKFASDEVVMAAAQRATNCLLSSSIPLENLFGESAFIQSGAWLLLQDAKVSLKGAKPIRNRVRLKRGTIILDGGYVRDAAELAAVATALRQLIQADGGGKVRALHAGEMARWWVFIGFDIEEPTFVLETTGGRYRFILSFAKGKLLVLDELNALPDPRS